MNALPNFNNPIKSLDDIANRKDELQFLIDEKQANIVQSVKMLFEPSISMANSSSSIIRTLGIGFAIFNGIKTGSKVIKIIKSFFKRI